MLFSVVRRQILILFFVRGSVSLKEVRHMMNKMQPIAKMAKAIAEQALKRDANQTTCSIFYQPKAPASLEQFKNRKAGFQGYQILSQMQYVNRAQSANQIKSYMFMVFCLTVTGFFLSNDRTLWPHSGNTLGKHCVLYHVLNAPQLCRWFPRLKRKCMHSLYHSSSVYNRFDPVLV